MTPSDITIATESAIKPAGEALIQSLADKPEATRPLAPMKVQALTTKAPAKAPRKAVTKKIASAPVSSAASKKSPTKPLPAPAAKALAKPLPKPLAKARAKALPKAASQPPAKPVVKAVTEKVPKQKKPKLVRDSFTIPKTEYSVLEDLKQRSAKIGNAAKKSELLRAGIKALAAMTDASFKAALNAVPTIKTGRPAKD
jgi:hypothetical protein